LRMMAKRANTKLKGPESFAIIDRAKKKRRKNQLEQWPGQGRAKREKAGKGPVHGRTMCTRG